MLLSVCGGSYIIHEEQSAQIVEAAEKIRDWLLDSTDLSIESIAVQIDQQNGRDRTVNDAGPADLAQIKVEVDAVLLIQSANVMSEPRSLARLFAATKAGVPIVPAVLICDAEGAFEHPGNTIMTAPRCHTASKLSPHGSACTANKNLRYVFETATTHMVCLQALDFSCFTSTLYFLSALFWLHVHGASRQFSKHRCGRKFRRRWAVTSRVMRSRCSRLQSRTRQAARRRTWWALSITFFHRPTRTQGPVISHRASLQA